MSINKLSAMRISGTVTPPKFRPNMWKHFINSGCYTYALDLRLNDFFLVGDFIGKRCTEKVTDQDLIRILFEELDYFGYSIHQCETNFITTTCQRKIYLQREEHTGYYHFLRQDFDGIWSHKFPQETPVRIDSVGELILDPDCMVEAPFSGWCFVLEKKRVE